MKASELKETGWYWYRMYQNEPEIVLFSGVEDVDRPFFQFFGSLTIGHVDDMFGDFIGPLEPPEVKPGCGAILRSSLLTCGERDIMRGYKLLCTQCGGKYKRAD